MEVFEFLSQFLVRGQEMAQANEGAHDGNVDLDCLGTGQDGGQHGDALFRKGIGGVLAVLAHV
jgi:hypothetical protein